MGLLVTSAVVFITDCGSAPVKPNMLQLSPRATVIQFTMCLDTNNIDGALDYMAHPSGRLYVVLEKYEMRDEIARLQRVLGNATINKIGEVDRHEDHCTVMVEYNYYYHYNAFCIKIGDRWYITSFREDKPGSTQ